LHHKKNRKKSYNWFLSRPYLFLNNYKNFKIRKFFPNHYLIFLYKKYFRFFRVLKRINFNFKHKKTNNIFFMKIFFNPDLKNRSFRNKYFSSFLKLKHKIPYFNYSFLFKKNKIKINNLSKRLIYF
jgi:hypothetical protein